MAISSFPKNLRNAADGVRRYILGTGLENPGAQPLVVAIADSVVLTSSQPAVQADWMEKLQQLPYRTSFTIRTLSDGRVSAVIKRLDPVPVGA